MDFNSAKDYLFNRWVCKKRMREAHLNTSSVYQIPWRSIVSLDGWTSSVIENIFILNALQLPSGLLYISR